MLRVIVRYTSGVVAIALLYLVWTLASRWIENRQAERATGTTSAPASQQDSSVLKIVQFYAYPSAITEGEQATLCYGVTGSRSLKLEPAVEALTPSLDRCFAITPDENTRYTLTATAGDGRTVSASFVLEVRPDPAMHPRIVYFVERGRQAARDIVGAVGSERRSVHSLCFLAQNVKEVQIDPPVLPPTSAFRGCFYVTPQQTTTYTLTATGPKGRTIERQLTVRAP